MNRIFMQNMKGVAIMVTIVANVSECLNLKNKIHCVLKQMQMQKTLHLTIFYFLNSTTPTLLSSNNK